MRSFTPTHRSVAGESRLILWPMLVVAKSVALRAMVRHRVVFHPARRGSANLNIIATRRERRRSAPHPRRDDDRQRQTWDNAYGSQNRHEPGNSACGMRCCRLEYRSRRVAVQVWANSDDITGLLNGTIVDQMELEISVRIRQNFPTNCFHCIGFHGQRPATHGIRPDTAIPRIPRPTRVKPVWLRPHYVRAERIPRDGRARLLPSRRCVTACQEPFAGAQSKVTQ